MRAFAYLAIATAIGIIILMVLGAYVKATGAGLACPEWPKCFDDEGLVGDWIPASAFTDPLVAAEWWHRTVASVVGLGILGVAIWAWRYREQGLAMPGFATAAVVLLPLQVYVGGLTVTSLLEPLVVTSHQGLALLIFGSSTVVAVLAVLQSRQWPPEEKANKVVAPAATERDEGSKEAP